MAEQVKYEQNVTALHDQLQQSGLRLTEAERMACFARLEEQRLIEYRTRHTQFKQEFPSTNELFTWTLNNLHLKLLTDYTFTTPEQIVDKIRQLDSCSPWPDLLASDFCTLWCRVISLNVDSWRFQLRDYPKPWLEMTDLFLWGPLAGAERCADWQGQRTVQVIPGNPWPEYTVARSCWPLKFYYDFTADLKTIHMCYGSNWEPTLAWLSQRLEDIFPRPWDMSVPRLAWWDRVRHLLHGRLYIVSESMHWLCATSLNPYNATEFFTWQWSQSTVCWETGHFRLGGDVDILYRTASKYDGVCHLFHLPGMEMNIFLDWLSLHDPLDHHAVKPCNSARLAEMGITNHDSYRHFRANRLSMRITCSVHPPTSPASRPWCLFYTSILKFADRLRMCLTKVARPIRRGSVFGYQPLRKPLFGRLLQLMEFTFNLPHLEVAYWVSYANRTGVHLTTGPVHLSSETRLIVEGETKVPLIRGTSSGAMVQPFVMFAPMRPIQHSGLIRRPIASWSVIRLSASVHDSRIRLRHNPNLPGQVVQLLLKSAKPIRVDPLLNQTGLTASLETETDQAAADTAEDFLMVPLLHYDQVGSTSPPPPDQSVRVHIPGRRATSTNAGNLDASGDLLQSSPNSTAAPSETEYSTQIVGEKLTHENLTPTHRLVVNDLKLRWTEHTRNLVYILMDTYQHAQSLKRNLSARATRAIQLRQGIPVTSPRNWSTSALNLGFRGTTPSVASDLFAQNSSDQRADPTNMSLHTNDSEELVGGVDVIDTPRDLRMDIGTHAGSPIRTHSRTSNEGSNREELSTTSGSRMHWASQSETSVQSNHSGLSGGLEQIPMLAQLLEEVDTARFYAYCEEEPKQTNVIDQLHGLTICSESLVTARNWHVELLNSQLLLKTDNLAGYILVTAARAKLDALTHPPIWKDAQLLNKSSLVGHLECMQYYATVGQVDPGIPDLWLSTPDVADWAHVSVNADEDELSGRPEVVGCGHSVGGVVTARVVVGGTPRATAMDTTPASEARIHHAPYIQLQRMISRCCCEIFYVHYEPADSSNLPPAHLIPPLPFDETKVVRTQEGADTVTLLHHTLNICTNSLQYHMIVGIVNNLLLYVEPQRKAQLERNRVAFGLMSESQARSAILRNQEVLRCLVAEQRRLERDLWSFVRETMAVLELDRVAAVSQDRIIPGLPDLVQCRQPSENAAILALSIHYARHLEAQVTNLKTRIVDCNALLSQRLAQYQQLQIRAQRRHMRSAMSGTHSPHTTGASLTTSASASSLLKQHRKGDRASLSPPTSSTAPHKSDSSMSRLAASGGGPTQPGEYFAGDSSNSEQLPTQLQRESLSIKNDPYPAEIVRRNEVCFEHARWRMTEHDGQIGLADVELRGFLYAKTHRQDDSGSHWLELGWIRVDSLGPDSFYKEVLLPDVGGGHYAGGPILRIACSELAPVGGLSVKEAMEISVAPMVLQISKQFYRVMMPYFFPEKADESVPAAPGNLTPVTTAESALSPRLPSEGPDISTTSSIEPLGLSTSLSTAALTKAGGGGWTRRRRLNQVPGLVRHLYRGHTESTVPSAPLGSTVSSSTTNLSNSSTGLADSVGPSVVEDSTSNLTVEAALSGQTSCTAVDPQQTDESGWGWMDRNPFSAFRRRLRWKGQATTELDASTRLPGAAVDLSKDHTLRSFLCQPQEQLQSSLGAVSALSLPSTWPHSVRVLSELLPSAASSDTSVGSDDLVDYRSNTTPGIVNPVEVMRERARQNNVFLYIKIPGFPICLSYKGEKQKNLTDVTRFQLNIPTMEHHNCVWTWLDFAMEVKTRIRKQLVKEVIKKKFTPGRRLPFLGIGRSTSERSLTHTSAALGSSRSTLSTVAASSDLDQASTAAQEERVRREVVMLLGRHAQP
ncbi:hypothetical protein CRM22_009166 [Opisthorchis felineus]|nr:hypothetical protein CRM22_009166 [Opisthorchis felineus]